MFFPGENTTRRKSCLAGYVRAICVVCVAAAVLATVERASAALEPVVGSEPWQARFEAWVEAELVHEQLVKAAKHLSQFNPDVILRVLDELEMERVQTVREMPQLPAEVVPALNAKGLAGASLKAARLYANGSPEAALQLVEDPSLEANANAAYFRAQLLDESTRDSGPRERIDVIHEYRYALSLSPESPQAPRTRLRMGQIYLEIRFFPEAAAALRALLERVPESEAARISAGEAAYLDGDAKAAIDTIIKLDLKELSPASRRWALRRIADSLFRARRFPAAIIAYHTVIDEAESLEDVAPLARLRLGAALLQTGKPQEAQSTLRMVISAEAPPRQSALAGLLLARAARELEAFDEASETARQALETLPHSPEAALAAVEVLEAERLADRGKLNLPDGAQSLIDPAATQPEYGLLAYRVAAVPGPHGTQADSRGWLGKLLKTLPEGAVRELAHDDLEHRLQAHLKEIYAGKRAADPEILDDVEEYLRPKLVDENTLLIGLEAFYRSGRWQTCMRWGRALFQSEVRPIRRGLGAWRAVRCKQAKEPKLVSIVRLLEAADGGTSGPFALALAALASEKIVRKGDLSKAVRVYERALESVAEPRLLGPGLLRLGELQLALGQVSLGTRRILRGLSLTDQDDTVTDPFRKAGLVALARALAQNQQPKNSRAAKHLKHEQQRAEEWWKPAYAYLALRAGIGLTPEGNDVFSRAAFQIREADRLERRIKKLVGEIEKTAAKRRGDKG